MFLRGKDKKTIKLSKFIYRAIFNDNNLTFIN